ncbi:MAG: alpha/beta fold hydrolase [Armatimonadetes bacterium]|nr:alpha/beta fold hydrolase [Armatimonadota bacterium]
MMPHLRKLLSPALLVLLMAAVGEWYGASPTEAAASRTGGPSPTIFFSDDGGAIVETSAYRASVGADGNLHSLRVGDVEMLDDQVAISLGSFFYADGPRRLTSQSQTGHGLEATDGTYLARYRFREDEIQVTLVDRGTKPAPYFVVLAPSVSMVQNSITGEVAAVPANEQWGSARFHTAAGTYLELAGGARVWGPWLGRQVWEVTEVPAGGRREVFFRVGHGDVPKATLEQLLSLRADVIPESALIPQGLPIEVTVAVDNRSHENVSGLLSIELSASRNDLVLYTSSSMGMPAQRVTEKQFRWRISEPDFYMMKITATAGGREIGTVPAAAGYRVSEIRPVVSYPPDFQEFWQRVLDEAGAKTLSYRIQFEPDLSGREVNVWVVRYQSLDGSSIYGWYVSPAAKQRHPGLLYLSGYGAKPISPPVALARRGWAVLAIDVRGNAVDRVRPRPFEDYSREGIESPETFVYREIVGHALNALRFLRSREEVDPKAIAVVGVSEGGGLGIMLGALSPDVAAVAADAPMLVDFPLSLRSASWPYTEIARYLQQHPRSRTEVIRTLSYFDAVNFAPEVHCPILLSVGLLDSVSLPAAVFGLYNVLPEPKEMVTFPDAGHEGGGEDHRAYLLDWLQQTVANRPDS